MNNPPRFRPPRALRITLICFLTAGLICDLLYVIESLIIGLVYPDYYNVDAPFAAGEEFLTYASLTLGLIRILIYITTIVLFCCWIYRANANAHALGAQDMKTSPGWSVGWWFIPIMNLAKPYYAMIEIYQASDPDHGADDWQDAPKPTIFGWWWAAWLLGGLASNADAKLGAVADHQMAHASSWTGLIAGLLAAIAAFLVIRIIGDIDSRQLVKATENPMSTQRYCLACDYDLSGSVGQAACPECGQPVPRSITA